MNQVEVKRKQVQAFTDILGIVMLLIMGSLIGSSGVAYLAAAVEIFTLLTLLIAESIPDAMGKMLRSRRVREQPQNASLIRRTALLLQCGLGILGMCLMLLLADLLAGSLFLVPNAALVMRILAPVLLLRVIGKVILGCFQENGIYAPEAVVGVLRPILVVGFGFLLVPMLQKYGAKVDLLLLNESFTAMYGAAGLAAAILIAEALTLLFLLITYLSGRYRQRESARRTESVPGIIRTLYLNMAPFVMILVLARLPVGLGLLVHQRNAADASVSAGEFGLYYGKYLVLCAIPILLCAAFLMPVGARGALAVRRTQLRLSRDICGIGLHLGMVYAVFPAALFIGTASHLGGLFGGEQAELLTRLFRTGAVLIFEIGLAVFFIQVLLYSGKGLLAIGALGGCLMAFCFSTVLFVGVMRLGVVGLVCAGLFSGAVLCAVSAVTVILQLGMSIDWLHWILLPLVCGALACGGCILFSHMLGEGLGDLWTFVISFVLSLALYLAPQISLGSFREPEVRLVPGGKMIRNLFK